MSLPWDWFTRYARWREDYLTKNPEKRLFPWLFGGIKQIPRPKEPVITLGEKGKGLLILGLVLVVILAGAGDS